MSLELTGEAEHIAYAVELLDVSEIVFCNELRTQGIAWQEHGFCNGNTIGIDMRGRRRHENDLSVSGKGQEIATELGDQHYLAAGLTCFKVFVGGRSVLQGEDLIDGDSQGACGNCIEKISHTPRNFFAGKSVIG